MGKSRKGINNYKSKIHRSKNKYPDSVLRQKEGGENVHHLQNVCNNGKSVEENLKVIKATLHKEWHDLFGNKNTIEAIKTVFKFGKSQLNEDYITEQEALWKKYGNNIIKKSCYSGKTSDNKGQKGGLSSYTQ